jgi:hypothetical protein
MTTPENAPTTGEEQRAAQAEEYGKYRAKQPIKVDGVLAFNTGDLVPASHVTRQVVDKDLVEEIPADTKKKG